MHEVLEQLGRLRLVPMVVMDSAAHVDGFGEALVAGGRRERISRFGVARPRRQCGVQTNMRARVTRSTQYTGP
jgi:hypothetical protein